MALRHGVLACGVAVLAACAAPTSSGRQGGGRLDPVVKTVYGATPALDEASLRRHASECHQAVAQMWRVLAPVHALGAEVELVYWAEGGALTMLSWRRLVTGGAPGEDVDDAAFARSLRSLCTYVGGQPHGLRIIERRERSAWAFAVEAWEATPRPGEAKTLPVDAPAIPTGPFAALEKLSRERWVPLLRVPSAGTASLEVTVELDDDRVLDGSAGRFHSDGGGADVRSPVGIDTELAGALVGFTQGVGPRRVRALLEARRQSGDTEPRWRVVEAATVRSRGVEQAEAFTTGAEYRRLHEQILRQLREEVTSAAVLAVTFTGEQLALWVVGGWAVRGMGATLELAAGPVMRVLGRGGGAEAVQWLECLLARMPESEREALGRLWTKAAMEGERALSAAEKTELRALFRKLDQLVVTPLDDTAKREMWTIARRRYWQDLARKDLELLQRLTAKGAKCEVHHRLPLEFAHLAGESDINELSNLVAVEKSVHESIGRVWTALRATRIEATLVEVQEVMTIVDRNYGRWYNATFDQASQLAALQAAEQASLKDVADLVARMGRH